MYFPYQLCFSRSPGLTEMNEKPITGITFTVQTINVLVLCFCDKLFISSCDKLELFVVNALILSAFDDQVVGFTFIRKRRHTS